MTKDFLKKNGVLIEEYDFDDRLYHGCYGGTRWIYYYNDRLYEVTEYNNAFSYNGKNATYIICDDVRDTLKKYNSDFWRYIGVTKGLQKLKDLVKEVN